MLVSLFISLDASTVAQIRTPAAWSFRIFIFLSDYPLKVPKRENFSLAFFTLSEPIWVGDLGIAKKNSFFCHVTPDFDGFPFFAAY
jgi:hypothetical protein